MPSDCGAGGGKSTSPQHSQRLEGKNGSKSCSLAGDGQALKPIQTTRGVRTSPFPSPRPSPQERGRIVARVANSPERSDLANGEMRGSLPPNHQIVGRASRLPSGRPALEISTAGGTPVRQAKRPPHYSARPVQGRKVHQMSGGSLPEGEGWGEGERAVIQPCAPAHCSNHQVKCSPAQP